MMLNLLSSHDVPRWIALCQGDRDYFLQSYAIAMFYPGWPCIYYGDEIFMEGGQDPFNRIAMKWESPEFSKEGFESFKSIVSFRQKEALKKGDFALEAKGSVLSLMRAYGSQKITLAVNLGARAVSLPAGKTLFARKAGKGKILPGGIAIFGKEK
jgi:glycosidase